MNKADLINKVFTYRFSFNELAITRARLQSLIGYKPGAAPKPLIQIIDKIFSHVADYCNIQGGFIIKDELSFNQYTYHLSVDKKIDFNLHEIVYKQVRSAERIAVFVCTAGPGISDWSKKLMAEGDLAMGYIVDVVGSEVVETAVDKIQFMLSEQITAAGLKISNRFSPGYCSWNVSEQHKLFSLLPDNFCGIRLSNTALMYPIKSVSGIIGIGKNISFNSYTCKTCDMQNCLYRNRRMSI
jgi:hypothetical protein